MKHPALWATNDNYSSGPDIGTPTKVDPGTAANGFIRGTAAAAQHINYQLNPLAENARRVLTTHALSLRLLDTDEQDDTTEGLGVGGRVAFDAPIILAKGSSSGVVAVTDGYAAESRGALNQITDTVRAVVRGPSSTRTLAIGAGGTQNCTSTNNGSGWTAGASTGLLSDLVAAVATGTDFIVASGIGGSAHGTGAGAWSTATISQDISDVATAGDVSSLAALTGGVVVAAGDGGSGPVIARTTDGGVTWAAASGAIPNAATQEGSGWVTGDEGATLWHAGYRNDFLTVNVAVSTNGNTWSLRATLTSALSISGIRIMKCPITDLLVLALQHIESVEVRASVDGGVTWSEPQYLLGFVLANLGVANGRLFGSRGGRLFASEGVGSEG